MNSISTRTFAKKLAALCLILMSYSGFSQTGTSVLFTVTNMVQTSSNSFQYDVYITNTGTTSLKLRGYSWGLNPSSGLANGGTITHSFISRDASLSTLPVVTASYANSQIRATTTNAAAGNEVQLTPNVPVRMATMRVFTTTSWPTPNYNPFLPSTGDAIQVSSASGKIGRASCRERV